MARQSSCTVEKGSFERRVEVNTYQIANRQKFFSTLWRYSYSKSSAESLSGFIFPSPHECIDLKIYEFRFGANGHLSYVLAVHGLAWVDEAELPFLSKWLLTENDTSYLRIEEDATFSYPREGSGIPLWISGGMSRGPHFFHYGHCATDYLPALGYIAGSTPGFQYIPITSKPKNWHFSLARVAGLERQLSRGLVLRTPSAIERFPHITCHSIHGCVFVMSPFMPESDMRRMLINHSLSRHQSNRGFGSTLKPSVVFLSRRKTGSTRICNEDYLCNQLAMEVPRFLRIDPEEYDISDLLCWLDGTGALIISAASSSLDPIMQYGCRTLRYIVFYSLSIKETLDDADIYSIYAKRLGQEYVQRVYVSPLKSVAPSWDDPIEVDPQRVVKLITLMEGRSEVSYPYFQVWGAQQECPDLDMVSPI